MMALRGRTARLIAWGILVLLPFAPYATPLVGYALADTPLAYLAWVPVIAVIWSVDSLRRIAPYPDDPEINLLMGGTPTLLLALTLLGGPHLWPFVFTSGDIAFLLWPLWALSLAWLWFGVGVTRRLLAPLAFLYLAWPPLLTVAATHTQGVLLALDGRLLRTVAAAAGGWLRQGTVSDTFLVLHAGHTVTVTVASACSGADSLLAAIIVLPFVLSRVPGHHTAKVGLALLTGLGALALNVARMAAILAALHAWGAKFALGTLHPVLGPALFVVLALAVMWGAERLGLLDAAPPTGHVALPGWQRTSLGAGLGLALAAALIPVASAPAGMLGTPVAVRSFAPVALVPALPGFRPVILGRYDDASILGPGSRSVAVAYSDKQGAYVLAQMWVATSLGAFSSYTYNNCLLFHGDNLLAVRPLRMPDATLATLYAVALAPTKFRGQGTRYLDIEWTHAIALGSRTEYLRTAVAVPVEAVSVWAGNASAPLTTPVITEVPWVAPSRGRLPAGLRGDMPKLVAFAERFDRFLEIRQPL